MLDSQPVKSHMRPLSTNFDHFYKRMSWLLAWYSQCFRPGVSKFRYSSCLSPPQTETKKNIWAERLSRFVVVSPRGCHFSTVLCRFKLQCVCTCYEVLFPFRVASPPKKYRLVISVNLYHWPVPYERFKPYLKHVSGRAKFHDAFFVVSNMA